MSKTERIGTLLPSEFDALIVANGSLPNRCAHFSEDDRDNPDLQPEPTDPNQLRLPFLLVDLFGIADPDVLVFDTAIIDKKDLIPQWAH